MYPEDVTEPGNVDIDFFPAFFLGCTMGQGGPQKMSTYRSWLEECGFKVTKTIAHDLAEIPQGTCPLTNLDRARASGNHPAAPKALPAVCGAIAVGTLPDGARVLFRSPGGAMAERAVTKREWCSLIPDDVDDALAAAIQNPGVSAWNVLEWRAKLRPGERVLILGATGVAGQIAVQLARHFGAGRIVAAGRNPRVLASLTDLGADATIQLDQPDDALRDALCVAAGDAAYDVVLDYLWGHPTEVFISTLGEPGMELRFSRTRLIQVGVMAGAHVRLPADVLRSSGLEILGSGTGNAPSDEVLARQLDQVLDAGPGQVADRHQPGATRPGAAGLGPRPAGPPDRADPVKPPSPRPASYRFTM